MAITENHGANELRIQLIYGAQKFNAILHPPDGGTLNDLAVSDLAEEVNQLISVPTNKQKLIFKGKSLQNSENTLVSFGICNGSKIMVLGKKYDPLEDEVCKNVLSIEHSAEKVKTKFLAIAKELDGIEKGYLDISLHSEAITKISRRLIVCGEDCMKMLEKLDAIQVPEEQKEIKIKKRSVIIKIQEVLDNVDNMKAAITSKAQNNG